MPTYGIIKVTKESLLKELQSLKNLHGIYVEQINEYERKMRKEKHNSDEDWRLYHECEQIRRLLDDTKIKIEVTIVQAKLITAPEQVSIGVDPDPIETEFPNLPNLKTKIKGQGDND